MLNEINQTEDRYHMINSHMEYKNKINEQTKQRQARRCREQSSGTRGEKGQREGELDKGDQPNGDGWKQSFVIYTEVGASLVAQW